LRDVEHAQRVEGDRSVLERGRPIDEEDLLDRRLEQSGVVGEDAGLTSTEDTQPDLPQ
jgi:hypothetical protein